MNHVVGVTAVVFTLAASAATSTSAATMDFSGLPSYGFGVKSYFESGITATARGGDLGTFGVAGAAHMDDGGTSLARRLDFTMGGRFDAIDTRILPSSNAYCFEVDFEFTCGVVFDNIKASGYREGVEVAVETFYMGDTPNSHFFGSSFSNLDVLSISFVSPPAGPSMFCFDSPCTHFSMDSITLNPSTVPLPASIWLLLGGVAALGGAAWRRST